VAVATAPATDTSVYQESEHDDSYDDGYRATVPTTAVPTTAGPTAGSEAASPVEARAPVTTTSGS
jgi:hypothetical protein